VSRAILLVLDSLGIGGAPDAAAFGDAGADTLGHIVEYCAHDIEQGGRGRPLAIPTLSSLGLAHAASLARGGPLPGMPLLRPIAAWGCARERSTGKDSVSGHWEIAGLPVDFEWGYFRDAERAFPDELIDALAQAAGADGVLGNCHASGTEIIERLGEAHMQTGQPIVYTSADSVLQIAAHEERFGLRRLQDLCVEARRLADAYRIGRVIARPFTGHARGSFRRTANRHDYAVPPGSPTVLDALCASGGEVVAIGKVADLFARQGISRRVGAHGMYALMTATRDVFAASAPNTLVFTNLVDFDQDYGHRRDVAGYAAALEAFDTQLPSLLAMLGNDDLLLLTADHGNDPTWAGSDHTREQVPIIAVGPRIAPGSIGRRDSFADIGQSLASWFALPRLPHGTAFL
jgi:phosphopentomutase